MPETFVVQLNTEDHAAYLVYRELPPRVQAMIRSIVFMVPEDQRLVDRLVSIIRRAGASSGSPSEPFLPSPAPVLRLLQARRPARRRSTRRVS
jgi:hypothetical protein